MMVMTMCTSISVLTLPLFVHLFGLYAVMWGYGGICVLGIFFSIFVMNETKGKNLNKLRENYSAYCFVRSNFGGNSKKKCKFGSKLLSRNIFIGYGH